MLSYLAIEQAKQNQDKLTNNQINLPEMSYALVEKLVKVNQQRKKCYQNIFNIEKGYLDQYVGYMIDNKIEEQKLNE